MALQNVENLSEFERKADAWGFFLGVASELAERHDYENALAVARLIRETPQKLRFADALVLIYAKQVKAGDVRIASVTLSEALDADTNIEHGTALAARYRNWIQLAYATGGRQAADPVIERLYQMAELETEPAEKQGILSHLVSSEALVGDFANACRSAEELPQGSQRDKALLGIASAEAAQGDTAGARMLASKVSLGGWDNLALQQFGVVLALSGDYLGALSTIEKEGTEMRAESLGQLAFVLSGKSGHWAGVAAQMAEEAAKTTKGASFPLQLVAVARGTIGDFSGALQIVSQLTGPDRQWPLSNLTEQLVKAGRKGEALAAAYSQEDPLARASALLGAARAMLAQIENAVKPTAAESRVQFQ
jgi:hypothetical protein